jgi:hypothetical protein
MHHIITLGVLLLPLLLPPVVSTPDNGPRKPRGAAAKGDLPFQGS